MKKQILKSTLFIALVLSFTACKKMDIRKHHGTHTETEETSNIEVHLKYGETYSYTLPTNQSDDPYAITVQATNYGVSELNAAQTVYTYTAKSAVVATSYEDHVTIANVEEVHSADEHHGSGQCDGGRHIENEIERTINIHFVVENVIEAKSAKNSN